MDRDDPPNHLLVGIISERGVSMRYLLSMISVWIGFSGVSFAESYMIDPSHTEVGFTVTHMVISDVRGQFNSFSGSFDFDSKNGKLEKVEAKIETSSIDTNEEKRDKHLRSADFFDVEKFPQMIFKSDKVEYQNAKPTKIHGTLTLHGKTNPVVLEVHHRGPIQDPWGMTRIGFEAKTQIKRKDYDMTWNKQMDKGGLVVGEEVEIQIRGEATAKK